MIRENIYFGDKARAKMKEGVDLIAKAVGTSYGPQGNNAVIYNDVLDMTNDGVTIARAVEQFQTGDLGKDAGIKLLYQAASKTNKEVGDGTTLTTLLTAALINNVKDIESFKKNATKVAGAISKSILKRSNMKVNKSVLKQVATVSSRNNKIGEVVSDVVYKIGENGIIDVNISHKDELVGEVVKGMQFGFGYKTPKLINDYKSGQYINKNIDILITEDEISTVSSFHSLLLSLERAGKRDLIIICSGVTDEVVQQMIINKERGSFHVMFIESSKEKELQINFLGDIAVLTDGVVVKDEEYSMEHLGKASEIRCGQHETIIINEPNDSETVKERINDLESLVEKYTNEKKVSKKLETERRLSLFRGGIGMISIGSTTEIENRAKVYLVDDAINACKAALKGGVIAGGGSALVRMSEELGTMGSKTAEAFRGAFLDVFSTLVKNTNINTGGLMMEDISKFISTDDRRGMDLLKGEKVDNMFEAGIVDPALVFIEALRNATSTAISFVSTDLLIVK